MLHKEEILFSKEECDEIISYMETGVEDIISVDFAEKHTAIGGKMLSNTPILENEKKWFIDKIIKWVNNIPNLRKIKNNNILPVYRNYKSGDYFVKHNDHIKNGPLRIYTVSVHLNSQENFTGGEFKIYENNEERTIKFQTGKVYIFDSSTPHSVDMITSGNRITLMLFIEKQNLENNLFL